jgi:hypothetical protein
MEVDDSFPLSEAVAGSRLRISKVSDEDAAMLDYFGDRNLVPGRLLAVREVRAIDGVVIVENEDAEVYALGEPLARSRRMRPPGRERLGMSGPRHPRQTTRATW